MGQQGRRFLVHLTAGIVHGQVAFDAAQLDQILGYQVRGGGRDEFAPVPTAARAGPGGTRVPAVLGVRGLLVSLPARERAFDIESGMPILIDPRSRVDSRLARSLGARHTAGTARPERFRSTQPRHEYGGGRS
jgi:hypothetical protein